MEAIVYELNREGARSPARPRFCPDRGWPPPVRRGRGGPTNRTLSSSPDVNNPGYRAVTFDQVRDSYAEQVRGLSTAAPRSS
jgi:5-methyltetrahydrofolate--homocysteine methyltransferase